MCVPWSRPVLAQRTGAAVLAFVAIPSRHWIFSRAWDRFPVPHPFATVHGYFAPPLVSCDREEAEHFCQRIESALDALERQHDSVETKIGQRAMPGSADA